MGAKLSRPKPRAKPKLPMLFDPIGCSGLTTVDLSESRLKSAPFLFYGFTAKNMSGIQNKIRSIFQNIYYTYPVVGPVYLFTAQAYNKNKIKCHLYFPSISKTDKKPLRQIHMIGIAHRWMHRLLYSPVYTKFKKSNCTFKAKDNKAMVLGCETGRNNTKATKCMPGKKKPKRAKHTQPLGYYKTYRINLKDRTVSPYVHGSSINASKLSQNILSEGLDMYKSCRYMLISNNQKYFFLLKNNELSIWRTKKKANFESLCMKGYVPAVVQLIGRLRFRSSAKHLYATINNNLLEIKDEDDYNATYASLEIATQDALHPISLVLSDDGRLWVADRENRNVTSSALRSMFEGSGGVQSSDYDYIGDYRTRLLNLVAYMKLKGDYREVPGVEQYSTNTDYIRQLLERIDKNGRETNNDDYI